MDLSKKLWLFFSKKRSFSAFFSDQHLLLKYRYIEGSKNPLVKSSLLDVLCKKIVLKNFKNTFFYRAPLLASSAGAKNSSSTGLKRENSQFCLANNSTKNYWTPKNFMKNSQRVKLDFDSIFSSLAHVTQVVKILFSCTFTIDFKKRK